MRKVEGVQKIMLDTIMFLGQKFRPLFISSHIQPMSLRMLRYMSTVIIERVATAIRCTCGHLWLTTSRSKYPQCPRCHSTISRKKHAVILESETVRKQKGASSGLAVQNKAAGIKNRDQNEVQQGNR
jgi:hypothetical protein